MSEESEVLASHESPDSRNAHERVQVGNRGPNKRSAVWKFFDQNIERGTLYSCCKFCAYKNKGRNTTTLHNHLLKHPQQHADMVKQRKIEDRNNRTEKIACRRIDAMFGATANKPARRYERQSPKFKAFKASLTVLAACSSMTLNMVETPEFGEFVTLDPRAEKSLPTRNTLKNWIVQYTTDLKAAIQREISTEKKFSVCIDLWTQPGMTFSYIGVTAHYYCQAKVKVVALACRSLPHPHTAEKVRDVSHEILAEWGFDENNVVRYVTDQGANIIAALRPYVVAVGQCDSGSDDDDQDDWSLERDDLLEYFNREEESRAVFSKRLSCFAHLLSCSCQSVIERDGSPVLPLKAKVLGLLNKFSKSGAATEDLKNIAGKRLLKVAKTRWNSFFYVLDRLIQLRAAVEDVCAKKSWTIAFNWVDIVLCRDLLQPFAKATAELEGDYPTASMIIPTYLTLKEHCEDPSRRFARFGNLMPDLLAELKRRFDHYINRLHQNYDPTALLSCMFHPDKTTELTEELFELGKIEMRNLISSGLAEEIAETVCPPADCILASHAEREVDASTSKRRRLIDNQGPQRLTKKASLDRTVRAEYLRILEAGSFEENASPLECWRGQGSKYGVLCLLGFVMCTIPATSASVERLFSRAGIVATSLADVALLDRFCWRQRPSPAITGSFPPIDN